MYSRDYTVLGYSHTCFFPDLFYEYLFQYFDMYFNLTPSFIYPHSPDPSINDDVTHAFRTFVSVQLWKHSPVSFNFLFWQCHH